MRLVVSGGLSAAALVLLLSGCVAPAPEPITEPTPVVGLLTCDDLAPEGLVAGAMTGADGVAPEPVPAIRPNDTFAAVQLAAAGGLECSWRVGEAPTTIYDGAGAGGFAYLTLEVLPNAAEQWQPAWAGDSPSDDILEVGGIEASTAVGESGWQLTAPVAESWVAMRLSAPGLGTTGTRYDGLAPDEVLARLGALAEASFANLQQASSAQLAWPGAELRQGDAVCNGGLDPQGIGMALSETYTEVEVQDPTASAPRSFQDAVGAAARSYACDYLTDTTRGPHIAVVYGAGELFECSVSPTSRRPSKSSTSRPCRATPSVMPRSSRS
ncbi:hypothetical protein [Agromyces subbeticus]|uniref:hypothetical protein n=1 Tax=Agromyces subbeticus TaxID=293890 RepID=UPI0012EB26FA|nr:hypothetical protein [Agromyces subbeticus]